MATLEQVMSENHVMPHSEEAENLILGTLITDSNRLAEVRDLLPVDAFYITKNKDTYKAILAIADRGEHIDVVTVMNECPRINSGISPFDVATLARNYTPASIDEYVAILNDKLKRRKFFEIGSLLQSNAFSEVNDVEDVLTDVRDKLDKIVTSGDDNVSTLKQALEGVNKIISRNMSGDTSLTGDPTGFKELDAKSGGLQTSDLIIIAAESSQGKTSLAIKLVMNSGCPVAFYSMEMKKEQIAARMLSMASGISSSEILFSKMDELKIQQLDKGVGKIYDKPIYFDDRSTSNIETILSSIRMMKMKYGIRGAVIDYLQILNVNMKGGSKEQQMGDVARRLKNLAKELDIWIIALSQLNRNAENFKPTIARLRDSGQIAEAADMVLLICRPEAYGEDKRYPYDGFQGCDIKGTAMIDVAKGRNIGLMRFLVGFHAKTTNFYDRGDAPQLNLNDGRAEELPF